MKTEPLTNEAIIAHLDRVLDVEFTFLRTEEPAAVLAALSRAEQDFLLDWVGRVASTNIQLAFQFITHAVAALDSLDRAIVEAWALHAMDTYDQAGLHKALAVIRSVNDFVRQSHERTAGCVFDDKAPVLAHFAHGLTGRRLTLEADERAWTDTETIHLPPLLASLPTPEANFLLYKATVAFLWAQIRFGTYRPAILDRLDSTDPDLLALYESCERLRIEARLARELPGLHRDMQALARRLDTPALPADWRPLAERLAAPDAGAEESLALAHEYRSRLTPLPRVEYQGHIDLPATRERMAKRMAKEKARLRVALADTLVELRREKPELPADRPFALRNPPTAENPDASQMELVLDDMPVPPPEAVRALATSVVLDFGEIPDEYLTPAGDGEYDPALLRDQEKDPEAVWSGTYHEEGAFLYQEWDYRRQHYRKNWCAVREVSITPVYDDFVPRTLRKYHGLVKHLRKTFEAMRDEDRVLRRQAHGDGVDIDALVEALADAHDGREMSDRLFTRLHRTERNIAVIFMVDMSGSTKGWINEAERESLVLLAEALETLGDRYAIYGFSGMARKRCEIYKIKTFDEAYDATVQARISGIEPRDYTRMGFAIRHLSRLLAEVDARTRILITLSDGKPDDYDSYRGEYGIEDTRRALLEARRQGIHPYCITIDQEARDYLPRLYGPAAYTVIQRVQELPLKVSDIYRRLTT